MIFSIPDYQISFPLRTDCLNTFVIENEDFLAKVVEGVQAQLLGEERGIFLYDGEKELPLPKNLRLVLNPFLMNPNDRQTLKALYQQLTEVANDEPERKAEINQICISYLDELLLHVPDGNISYQLDLDAEPFFKLYGVQFTSDYESLEERVLENIRIVSSYCHIPVIVFVNLKSFLSSKALEEVRQMASRYQVALLLLEPRERVVETYVFSRFPVLPGLGENHI